jgi:hypothetical protein
MEFQTGLKGTEGEKRYLYNIHLYLLPNMYI